MTNKEFAEKDKNFRKLAISLNAGGKFITRRQASKFRRKKGIVYRSTTA